MSTKPKLSLTMIVKNEAVHMRRVLSNARLFAEEIVIVDTGSTDGTRDIALEFTDKVYDFEWIEDFSAARNHGIERCTGEFIMWLDADDVISPEHCKILRKLVAGDPPWDVMWLPYIYNRTKAGAITTKVRRERVFRNGLGIFFDFPIHECLKIPPKIRRHVSTEVEVVHNNLGRSEPNRQRNLRILQSVVETDKYRKDFRMWNHLARDSQPEKGFLFFKKIVDEFFGELSPAARSMVLVRYGDALLTLLRFEEALELYGRAIVQYPLWREPFFGAGKAHAKLKRHDCALQMFLTAGTIAAPGKDINVFDQSLYNGEHYFDWLFVTQLRLKRHADVIETIKTALRHNPNSEMFRKRKVEYVDLPAAAPAGERADKAYS